MAGPRPKTRLAMATLSLVVAVCGCTSSSRSLAPSALATAAAGQAALPNMASIPPTTPLPASTSGQAPPPQTTDPQAMQQIVAEIQTMGALDPQARDELLENLRQTDPAIWPLVAQRVRADLAWRRQAQAREGRPGKDASADGHSARPAPSSGQTAGKPPERDPDAAQSPIAPPQADQGVAASVGRQPPADTAEPPTSGPQGPVTAASYEAKVAEGWQGPLDEAVALIESKMDGSPQSDAEFAQHARLRLLYLLKGQRDEALRPIPSLAPAMQEFWSKEVYGLATLLAPESISDSGRRKAEASQHLGTAVAKLGESCPLVVRNLAFVTEIQSYGTYKPFDKHEFVPGQRVLLYAEVENFKSIETAEGFHTATRSSYQIFDADGKRVAEHEFSLCEECCRRPRRDFFIVHDLRLPQRIYPGKHVLQLTVADLNSKKIGQTVIEFTVKSSEG